MGIRQTTFRKSVQKVRETDGEKDGPLSEDERAELQVGVLNPVGSAGNCRSMFTATHHRFWVWSLAAIAPKVDEPYSAGL